MKKDSGKCFRYYEQQKAICEIAAKLGVVAYRPDYHGDERDKNTVQLYLPDDAVHNRKVDCQPVRYSRSEAKDRHIDVNSECVYRDHFWPFENSDVNNLYDLDFANFGKVDLRGPRWKEVLEGHIRFALARKLQIEHIRSTGGFLELREADAVYNDLNRKMLEAMKMIHGRLFLGGINFYDEKWKKIVSGEESIYEELLGQKVYNFDCDFAVPVPDKELEEMIRSWNGYGRLPRKIVDVEAITSRVEQLGGINLIWY